MHPSGDDPSGSRLVIRVFGALEIVDGERVLGPRDLGGVRPKQLLEILLTARGHQVPTDRIAEMMWDAERPDDITASIQTFVSVLRRRLVEDRNRARQLVVTEAEAYRFATDTVDLDLDRFDELLERSAREPTRLARQSLERALSLVRGDVLEDEPYTLWAQDLRGSYQGRVLGARLDAAEAALAERDLAAALTHAEAAAALDRFSERAQRLSMLALYALGRQHDALSRYRNNRVLLDEELGLEPAAETRKLESAVLRQEEVTALLPRPVPTKIRTGSSQALLVGRCGELETVLETIQRGLEEGVTLTQIEAATGLGKTRLLSELRDDVDSARIGHGTCSLLERNLPYVPLAAALRDALADVELDGARLPALRQILPELTLQAPQAAFDEIEVLEALVALLTEHAPLVLLLDDIHLADHRTLAALAYLRRRAAFPGAIVTTARPTAASPGRPPHRLDADTRLELEPLTREDLAAFGLAEVYETTSGDPRLLVEALANQDPAQPSKTLTEALLAQCRAEGDWAYRVLIAACVLDQPFEPHPVAKLLEVDAAGLFEELERLCERRILRIDGLRFRFRNDLLREVLLETISPARQRLLRQRLDSLPAEHSEPSGYAISAQAG
jgi:DNA-binding SARP family transcriptional activator